MGFLVAVRVSDTRAVFGRLRGASAASHDDVAGRDRRVRKLVDELGLRGKSFEQMHEAVQAWLGRPVRIAHWASAGTAPCGLWVGRADGSADTIYVDMTSPAWQHVVAHEWGHILCGHDDGRGSVLLEGIDWLVPEAAVRFAFGRSSFSTLEERDAEAVGDAINLLRLDAERRSRRLASAGGFQGVL